MKTYRVVPFLPSISDKEATKRGAEAIAAQLQDAINHEAAGGWEFEGYEGVEVRINSGCLGMVFSSKAEVYRMLVFSRPT